MYNPYVTRLALRGIPFSLFILVALSSTTYAQGDVRIHLDSTAQVIRGFGAANIVGWRPDMTNDEIETAFGVGDGKLGFSLLRIRIPPQESQWSINLPTAVAAHSMGVDIIASPWSPPAGMKSNNDLVGGELLDEMYDEYAHHLDSFASYMAENDAPLYAVSVQNEPDIQVDYESCDWSAGDMLRFLRENASSIDTRVIAPESFQFRRLMSDPLLLDSAASSNLDIVGAHIYGGGLAPYPLAEEKGKEVWMTEHLVLETDLEANIGTAVEIQNVMTAGMSAYIWWYIVRYYGPISDGEEGPYGKGEITKRGYVMSQFSRFVRPGFVRVHTEEVASIAGVSTTAYRDSANVVIVAVNDAASAHEVSFDLEDGSVGSVSRYVTSETQDVGQLEDVAVSENRFTVTLGPNSVTTFVSEYSAVTIEEPGDASYELSQNYPNPFRSHTTIRYSLPKSGEVTLEVFDLLGRKVATLVEGRASAGSHQVSMDASQWPAGVYVYQLRVGETLKARQMALFR